MANRSILEREMKEYCELNGISDVAGFITQCMLKGFNVVRYGTSPSDNIKRQKGEVVEDLSDKVQKKVEVPTEEPAVRKRTRKIKVTNVG